MSYSPNTLDGAAASILKETKRDKGELAAHLNVSGMTLKRKLEGDSELMLSEAVALADFLGLSLQEVADLALQTPSSSSNPTDPMGA